MRFWIVKYGETVPFAPERQGGQLFRAGSIARALANRGHDVVWWTGRFEHQTKSFLAPKNIEMIRDPESELIVRLIDSPGYKSNVSIARFLDHAVFRKRLRIAMRTAAPPDLIVTSFPIPEIAKDCVDYGKRMSIPVVTDVRDLWPDVVVGRLEDKFGFFPESIAKLYRQKVARTFQDSDAIYATSEGYMRWAQDLGGRDLKSRERDKFFLLASEKPPSSEKFKTSQRESWEARGVDFSKTIFCWAGSLSSQSTHINMLDAFENLPEEFVGRVQLVVCGRGDLEDRIRLMAEKYPHIVFAGFVPNEDVKGLCLNSDIGLFCYDDVDSFRLNYTNKFGEYMGCGLPVMTTVTGPLIEGFAADATIPTGGTGVSDIINTVTRISNCPPEDSVRQKAKNIHEAFFSAPKVYSEICENLQHLAEEFNDRTQP